MVENGGKHPLGSKALLYLPREVAGRGLKCNENKYKLTKIKAAVNLCQDQDPTMKVVRVFAERSAETGHHQEALCACVVVFIRGLRGDSHVEVSKHECKVR